MPGGSLGPTSRPLPGARRVGRDLRSQGASVGLQVAAGPGRPLTASGRLLVYTPSVGPGLALAGCTLLSHMPSPHHHGLCVLATAVAPSLRARHLNLTPSPAGKQQAIGSTKYKSPLATTKLLEALLNARIPGPERYEVRSRCWPSVCPRLQGSGLPIRAAPAQAGACPPTLFSRAKGRRRAGFARSCLHKHAPIEPLGAGERK